jgi:hypothetical protein
MKRIVAGVLFALSSTGCVVASEDGDLGEAEGEYTFEKGVNGSACLLSPYDCKLRARGGNRIAHANGDLDWAVTPGAEVLDGNGDVLGVNKTSTLKFNYGQKRTFKGAPYVYAMTTSNKSSGWFPLSAVVSGDVLAKRVGTATAHRSGLAKMACYEVKDSSDSTLEVKKVVYDTSASPGPAGEAAGDYLPRLRANGKRSINLIYNVPGYGLGGPAIDHFPAGTKFQRLDVPTDSGAPSLDVKLWAQDSKGRFRKPAGTMKFVYGYIESKTGDVRAGWIAYDALKTSSGCP